MVNTTTSILLTASSMNSLPSATQTSTSSAMLSGTNLPLACEMCDRLKPLFARSLCAACYQWRRRRREAVDVAQRDLDYYWLMRAAVDKTRCDAPALVVL